MLAQQPDFFENLSAGQSPDYLWIGKQTSPDSSYTPLLEEELVNSDEN